jgi:hypothetical protein
MAVYYEPNRNLSLKLSGGLSRQINDTRISAWATATRPSAVNGILGYNIETGKLELYDGSVWQTFAKD